MDMLIDGVRCACFTGYSDSGTNPPAFPSVYGTEPFHILLNLAVQKYDPSWHIDPPTSSAMQMDVDYVRVWQ
jgi:hypothetical protein